MLTLLKPHCCYDTFAGIHKLVILLELWLTRRYTTLPLTHTLIIILYYIRGTKTAVTLTTIRTHDGYQSVV